MPDISYVFSIIALIFMTIPSVLKGKKMTFILILLFLGNALMGISYLQSNGINGAVSSFFGALTTAINFGFLLKHKNVPPWLITLYVAISILINLWVSGGFAAESILVIGASLAYQLGAAGKSGMQYRFWVLFNLLLWCVYDVISLSYSVLITHSIQFLINIVSMLIYDRKIKS